MIQKQTVTLWTASDGSEHRTLDDVKLREIRLLLCGGALPESVEQADGEETQAQIEANLIAEEFNRVTAILLQCADKVQDILTTTETSLPKARAVHGGKKPRKSKRVEALQATIPGTGLPPEILDEAKKAEGAK